MVKLFEVGGLRVDTDAVYGGVFTPLSNWLLFSTDVSPGEVPLELDEVRALASSLNTWLAARSVAP